MMSVDFELTDENLFETLPIGLPAAESQLPSIPLDGDLEFIASLLPDVSSA